MTDLNFVKDQYHDKLVGTEWASEEFDFWKLDDHDIPSSPGAYIFRARGTRFQYPIGTNSVFYIGQSKNLRQRLHDHLRWAREARRNIDDRPYLLYWPRYEYLAAFGTHYLYIPTWQGMKPKSLEDILLAQFAKKHLSFPVANGAGAWKRVPSIF